MVYVWFLFFLICIYDLLFSLDKFWIGFYVSSLCWGFLITMVMFNPLSKSTFVTFAAFAIIYFSSVEFVEFFHYSISLNFSFIVIWLGCIYSFSFSKKALVSLTYSFCNVNLAKNAYYIIFVLLSSLTMFFI